MPCGHFDPYGLRGFKAGTIIIKRLPQDSDDDILHVGLALVLYVAFSTEVRPRPATEVCLQTCHPAAQLRSPHVQVA